MKRSLELILEHARCQQGFLYLNRPEGITLGASRSASPPPSGMEERLLTWLGSFGAESPSGPTRSAEAMPPSEIDRNFAIVGISAERDGRPVIVAISVLDCRTGRVGPFDESLMGAVGRGLMEAGDGG